MSDLETILQQLERLTQAVQDLQRRVPSLVSIGQAAQTLGVTERTVRRWVRDRKLHPVKLGGVVRIDLSSITKS